MSALFWQKNSLATHIFFDLCLLEYLAQSQILVTTLQQQLHLIFENWISKNGCFGVYFELDFYCLCSLLNSSLKQTKNGFCRKSNAYQQGYILSIDPYNYTTNYVLTSKKTHGYDYIMCNISKETHCYALLIMQVFLRNLIWLCLLNQMRICQAIRPIIKSCFHEVGNMSLLPNYHYCVILI